MVDVLATTGQSMAPFLPNRVQVTHLGSQSCLIFSRANLTLRSEPLTSWAAICLPAQGAIILRAHKLSLGPCLNVSSPLPLPRLHKAHEVSISAAAFSQLVDTSPSQVALSVCV